MTRTIGEEVKYRVLDEESMSRGYGIRYETGTSKIKSIQFKLSNGLLVSGPEILKLNEETVTYKTVDMEYYSRGYGRIYETGTATIKEIIYALENNYQIKESDILPNS